MNNQIKTESLKHLTALMNSLEPNSNLRFVYRKAINSIDSAEAVSDLKEYQKLPGVGPKTIAILQKHLSEKGFINTRTSASSSNTSNIDNQPSETKAKPKRTRNYIPKFRSGGYAILVVLLKHNNSGGWMSKSEITTHAQFYCDSSFVYSATQNGNYTAWSAINSLVKNELVEKDRNRYSLSDKGIQVAKLFVEDLHSSQSVETLIVDDDYQCDFTARVPDSRSAIDDRRKFKVNEVRRESFSMIFSPITLDEEVDSTIVISKFHRDKELCKIPQPKLTNAKILKKDSYELLLCLDNREVRNRSDRDFFHNELEKLGIPIVKQNLALGDFCFIARDKLTKEMYVLGVLVERKCNSDLLSSIKDSRFKEQKHRLAECGHGIIYLVEGYNFQKDVRYSKETKMMQSALVETFIWSDFELQLTSSAQGTVEYLTELFRIVNERYRKNLVVGHHNNKWDTCIPLQDFNDSHQKTRAMTMNDLWQRQLCTISGLSKQKANLIAKKYPTMARFLFELEGKTELQRISLVKNCGDDISKFGPKLCKSIVEVFCE